MSDSLAHSEIQVGGAVPLDKIYIARRTDEIMLQSLEAGEYCNIVCPRQTGKTSAIVRVKARLTERGFRTANIDISGVLGTPTNPDEWFIGLLTELNRRLKLNCDVKAWWHSNSEPTANQRLLAFLRDEIIERHGERFVVFLDEIDHSLNLEYSDDFFLAIRSLYNERVEFPDFRRLVFCLSGVFAPNELIKRVRTTTYNIGKTIEFEDFDFDNADLTPFSEKLSNNSELGRALLCEVLDWTGGQPFLTASVCEKIARAGVCSIPDVGQLIEREFVSRNESFSDKDAEIHFKTIESIFMQRAKDPLAASRLFRQIVNGEKIVDVPTEANVALMLSGLVKRDKDGFLSIRNRIYRRRFDETWADQLILFAKGPAERQSQPPLEFSPIVQNVPIGMEALEVQGAVSRSFRKIQRLYISHSAKDDAFVRALREALDLHGLPGWIDSRELRGGDPLWPEIEKAIDASSGYAVVLSLDSLQSKWVGKELRYALERRKQRGGNDRYPVVPLSLDGTRLGVLEQFFDEEPIYVPVSSGAGGVAAAVTPILVALGLRAPADRAEAPQPQAEPMEELVLELTDLKIQEHEGVRRATARARLIYEPATAGQPEVASEQSWRFVAPLGPIEAEDLRWYLEKYAIWPGGWFRDRARRVEADLVTWGQRLHGAVLPAAPTANVMAAWARIDGHAGRRFSVHLDATATLEAGAPEADVAAAHEAATTLLGLPWELLHDGRRFLFQGSPPTRVRRRLPNTKERDVPVVAPPVRILLVTARPEDDACGYLDHRASAGPLVDATEALGELVQVTLLDPPTLPSLRAELDRARAARQPYHVLHFDGHGVYDRRVGLGGLCFEDPRDTGLLERRRHATVYTAELGALLDEHRVPLVFLEACQTAQAEQASESVATALLGAGVAAVAAMSHSVLVESARRFVRAFYRALASGARVGGAMLAGQRELKDDSFRGHVFGAGELRLEDWFVPVLYQEKADPQLFTATPTRQTQDDIRTALQARLGELPQPPETGFIGRSRELLALQRLLRVEPNARYAVLRGQGGEGKTALATEFARWMVRSQQVWRAAFVSVETHGSALAVLDAIGRQLRHGYSAAAFDSAERATLEVERLLVERSTLIVIDNMESVLLPPFLETPELLSDEARRELQAILALCQRLLAKGDTRIVFTSREALPAPFDGERQRRELRQLEREDAVKLIERALNREAAGGGTPSALAAEDAAREAIEQLADAVHGHARTLALLAPAIRSRGVADTQASLVELMAEMDRRFPGSRERSVYASVELSLQRLSPAQRERVQVLAAFHGAVDLDALRVMTQWETADIAALAAELIATGLATPDPYNHLSLSPALCPYLRGRLEEPEREALQEAWVGAMGAYVSFLVQQQSRNTDIAATLTALELPNLFALLDTVHRADDAAATINLSTTLFSLLQTIGKPRLVERVGQVRDAAAAALGEGWSHVGFDAQRTRIEQQLAGGRLREAFEGAHALLQRAREMGEQAYDDADYDLAMACWLLARVLKTAGAAHQALPLIDEARQRFEAVDRAKPNRGSERMASVCATERGDCLLDLGRLDEAAAAYEEGSRGAERLGDERAVAVGKGQLGTVRLAQGRHADALKAYQDARDRFTRLGEPGSVATWWHQTGRVYQTAGQPEAAEDAYRKSLALTVQLGDVAGQAISLGQLGNLYAHDLGRPEEAVAFYRQAAELYVGIRDAAKEGLVRNNLAETLRKLGPARLGEARQEILRAIECGAPFGHAAQPWTTWNVLADIETDAGNPGAAAEANAKAVAGYLAYRRDGGENHWPQGRLALVVTEALRSGGPEAAAEGLQQLAANEELPAPLRPFVEALQAIVAGHRESSLADAPELSYSMSAEILLLIETLEAQR